MTRYFVAIPLPAAVRERLALLRSNLPNARWIAPEDFHLTVRFIGDCDGPALSRVLSELDELSVTPFDIQLSGIGLFGHDKPRSIWIGTADNVTLVKLHQQVNSAIRRAGIEPDGRKFTPHVTLARLSKTRPASIAEALEGLGNPMILPFTVDSFTVYSSGRSRGGGPYAVEEKFPFADE